MVDGGARQGGGGDGGVNVVEVTEGRRRGLGR